MRRAFPLIFAILAGCASDPPPEPAWVSEADPGLVALGGTTRVDIEVDWFAMVPPDDVALEGLAVVAKRECPGKVVTIRRDTEIPATRWKSCRGDAIEVALDECRGRQEAADGVAYVHVLYCPVNPWGEAYASNGLCRRLEKPFPHWQIFVFKGTLKSRAILGLGADKIDRSCLVHEFGHALGLVANPEHRFEDGGGHCTDTGCVMTKPKLAAVLANAAMAIATGEIPWDYCVKCCADLERARAMYGRR
ncbi:MAG: hypothetical protein FD180_1771 [Planctomycetota bacterium]|nr:MAG: hypothetical protein FD180_1771 [Planctomycetota bacterium]